MPVESALHHVPDALGQSPDRNLHFLVDLLGLRLLDVFRGQLHRDDMRAQLRRNLGRIAGHVNGGFTGLAEASPARIGPDHHGQPTGLGFGRNLTQLLVHGLRVRRAGINRESDA